MKLKPLVLGVGIMISLSLMILGWQVWKQNRGAGSSLGNLLEGVALEEVARVVIVSAGEQVNLERIETGWQVREQSNYPADELKLRELLLQIKRLTLDRSIGEGEEILSSLGLIGPPELAGDAMEPSKEENASESFWQGQQLQLLNKEGIPLFTLTIGEQRSNTSRASRFSGRYLRLDDGETAWLTGNDLILDDFPFNWVQKRLFGGDFYSDLRVLQLERKGKILIKLERKADNAPWQLMGAEGVLDVSSVSELVRTVGGWELAGLDKVTRRRKSGRLGPGLPMKLKLNLVSGLQYELRFNEKPSKKDMQHPVVLSVSASSEADEDTRALAARLNELQLRHTMLLSRWDIKRLPASAQDLIDKDPAKKDTGKKDPAKKDTGEKDTGK